MQIYARKLNRRSLRVASVMLETIIPRSLRLPSRLNSSLPFATSFLSFQLFPSIRYFHFFPFVSSLPSGSFTFSFHFTRCSSRYVLPFVSTRTSRSFTYSFRCNSSISSVTSFLWFPLLHFIRCFFPFISTLPFRSLRHSFRFNSSLPFVTSFVRFSASIPFVYLFFRFKSFIALGPPIRFNSITLTSRSFTCLLCCCNSSISFATSFL